MCPNITLKCSQVKQRERERETASTAMKPRVDGQPQIRGKATGGMMA